LSEATARSYNGRRTVMNGYQFSRPAVPDVAELLAVIRRERRPGRVHHIELFLDPEVKARLVERLGLGGAARHGALQLEVRLHAALGYDVFRVPVIHKEVFPLPELAARDTARQQSRGDRAWVEEHRGPIQGWEDFERYRWPRVADIDLGALEWMERHLPENMGCYDLTAHILEMLTFLLGYETLCYAIYDQPELIDAVLGKVGGFYVEYTRVLCEFRCVSLIWGSDDMGFRSSTMVSPQFLRDKILPWHRACAEVAHQRGRCYLLHACGNLEEIMEELIAAVGIDGKHSFEDAILPVGEAFRRYGGRVAILGGIDVDFLCRAGEAAIRRRVRETLEDCFRPRGGLGYCLGTGNTVANYIPLESYLAMLDEGRRFL
jgi:uroporphyrinogen decarboxylase